ncbi:MAG: hypothetical protein RLZZ423_281 [Cyanobacteriota bacterium]
MADFAAAAPEDDQQPAAPEAAGPEGTSAEDQAAPAPSLANATEPLPEPPSADAGAPAELAEAPAETEPELAATAAPIEPIEPSAMAPEPTAESVAEDVAVAAALSAEPVVAEPLTADAVVAEPVVAEAPAAQPAAAIPAPASDAPSIASTIEVPASAPASSDSEGGEWALLVQKLSAWLSSGQLQQQWQSARSPLSLLAGLIALLLVLRIYSALLGVIEGLPLLPGLLELVGVVTVVRFSLTRLVRSDERQQLITGLQQRWKSFRGQG